MARWSRIAPAASNKALALERDQLIHLHQSFRFAWTPIFGALMHVACGIGILFHGDGLWTWRWTSEVPVHLKVAVRVPPQMGSRLKRQSKMSANARGD